MALGIPTAMLLAGGISAGSSLLTGLLNNNAAQDSNAEARRQFDLNYQFQRYQYEDMKRYNSYKNQVLMMRQAGLNPALMFGAGASPIGASSVGGVAPTANRVTPNYDFVSGLGSSASNMMSALSQVSLNDSIEAKNFSDAAKGLQESIGQEIDNQNKNKNYSAVRKLQHAQADLFDTEMSYQVQSMDARLQKQNYDMQISKFEAFSRLVSAAFAPAEHQAEYNKILAETAVAYSQHQLNLKQAKNILMSTIANYGMSKDDAYDLFESSIDLLESNTSKNEALTFDTFMGDIKKNPFGLGVGSYHAGETINKIVKRRARAKQRRNARTNRNR